MKSCGEFEGWIIVLADGELAGAERAELEAHLATCAACRGTLESYRGLDALARATLSVGVDELPALRPDRVAKFRIPQGGGARLWERIPRWAYAAAALLLVALTGLYPLRGHDVRTASGTGGRPAVRSGGPAALESRSRSVEVAAGTIAVGIGIDFARPTAESRIGEPSRTAPPAGTDPPFGARGNRPRPRTAPPAGVVRPTAETGLDRERIDLDSMDEATRKLLFPDRPAGEAPGRGQ